MAELTAEQRQNGDDIVEGMVTTHGAIWGAISQYSESIGGAKLHWSVEAAHIIAHHIGNNIVDGEIVENPNKYWLKQSASTVVGIGTAAIVSVGIFKGTPVGITLGAAAGALASTATGKTFDFAYEKWPTFKNFVDNYDASLGLLPPKIVQDFYKDMATEAAKSVNKHIDDIENSINKSVEDVSKAVKQVWNDTVKSLAEKYDWVKNNLNEMLNKVSDFVSDFWQSFKEIMADIMNFAEGVNVAGAWDLAKLGEVAPNIEKSSSASITLTPIALDLNSNSRIDLLSAMTATNKVFFDINNINTNATNDNFAFDNNKIFVKLAI